MYTIKGTIRYYNDYCVAYLSKDFIRYYRSIMPKYLEINPPMCNSHVTIVRRNIDKINNYKNWSKHEGKIIDINYNNTIYFDGLYYYMDCYSTEIEKIRLELGLQKYRPGFNSYHITIGNTKNGNNIATSTYKI